MKFILRKGKTSRSIEAPFNLVGGIEELKDFAEQILEQCARDNFSYGTIYINVRLLQGTNNSEPIPWEDEEK